MVYAGMFAFCLLIVNYRNVLVFANILVQSTVNYLVYINQILRKDFISPISFYFLWYALRSAAPASLCIKNNPTYSASYAKAIPVLIVLKSSLVKPDLVIDILSQSKEIVVRQTQLLISIIRFLRGRDMIHMDLNDQTHCLKGKWILATTSPNHSLIKCCSSGAFSVYFNKFLHLKYFFK